MANDVDVATPEGPVESLPSANDEVGTDISTDLPVVAVAGAPVQADDGGVDTVMVVVRVMVAASAVVAVFAWRRAAA